MAFFVRAQCSFQGASGLPEDVYINNVHMYTSLVEMTEAQADAFTAAWANFFNDGAHKVADDLSDNIDRSTGSAKIVFYDDTSAGSPLWTKSWTPAAIGAVSSLPAEVAAVLSIHANLTNVPETQANPSPPPAIIRPAARRRGRLYIGPLNVGVLSDAAGDARLSAAFITKLLDAGEELYNDMDLAGLQWAVRSREDATSYPVDGGFVDNSFDTQRRRGAAATTRTARNF